jgi:GAF domain-containing protein
VHPVFDAIVRTALRLLSCDSASFLRCDGKTFSPVVGAHKDGTSMKMDSSDMAVDPAANFPSRVMVTKTILHVPDWSAVDLTPQQQRVYDKLGVRSSLMLPLLRNDDCIGVLALGRMTAGAFTETEIALAKSFVDQALIAIENTRLFNETKESLEQQTAISEILRVISNTPGDVLPMLNAVAERALILCDAAEAGIFLVDGDKLRFATGYGSMSNFVTGDLQPLTRQLVVGRAIIDRETYHYGDVVPLLDTEYPDAKQNQAKFGFRAILCVPLMREDRAIGAVALWRTEARPFTDNQIALVKTFADQAAIAIENVRLFNETKEALNRQRAASDVLAAISGSIADTAPVFATILDSCERLFSGNVAGVNLVGDDGLIHLRAYHGPNRAELEKVFPLPLDETSGSGACIVSRGVVHYPDTED